MEIIDSSKLPLKAKSKADCRSELRNFRWQDNFVCRSCGHKHAYWIRTRHVYECANKSCKKQTSPTAGTQFHGAKKLEQIWIILKAKFEEKIELATRTIQKLTGLNHVTARRMRNRIEVQLSNPFRHAQQRKSAAEATDIWKRKLHSTSQTARFSQSDKEPNTCVILTFHERQSASLRPIVRMLR